MKKVFGYMVIPFFAASMVAFNGCKKEAEVPIVTTTAVSGITANTAVIESIVASLGSAVVLDRGVCWRTSHNPTLADNRTYDGNGLGTFLSNLTGLEPETQYYVRAYVIYSAGVAYADQLTFTTASATTEGETGRIIFNPDLTYGSVSDIDGNIYKTIQIGTQTWMAENLKTTKYFDGVDIPNVTDFTEWSGLTTGAYCWYYNDISDYKDNYGALYNWFAVNTGKLCPTGWHVPADGEWVTLTTYLGGNEYAGGKLKETGNTHWQSPYNWEKPYPLATNVSGFTAIPGGSRNVFGDPDFDDWSWISLAGYWWSTTVSIYNSAIYWAVINSTDKMHTSYLLHNQSGFSVRCVKD